MPDYSIIKDHAVKNVWCNPRLDKQLIFKTARVTPSFGSRSSFKVMRESHRVPAPGSKFHVFQIASFPERTINLTASNTWRNVASLCNEREMLIDIYLEAGLMLPRSECWIKNTNNGALILAIKQDRLIEFNTSDDVREDVLRNHVPYIKFYTSMYFSNSLSEGNPRNIHVYGKKVETETDRIAFSEQYLAYSNSVGKLYGYINGWLVEDIVPSNVHVGDYAEFVYDSSVKYFRSIDMEEVPTFTSDITNNDRHFVLPRDQFHDDILYLDDIDFYLVAKGGEYNRRGLYINRNNKHNIKMMTHQGFSISDELIQSLLHSTTPELSSSGPFKIIYVVRESGIERGLTSNSGRLNRFVLMSLFDERLPELAYENDLPVDEWKYRNIEKSPINELYGVRYDQMTSELLKNAYGYHTAARSLAPATAMVYTDENDLNRSIDISHLQQYGCTVFEYDVNGVLLGFYTHVGIDTYLVVNQDTSWVEIVTGFATDGDMVASEEPFLAIDSDFEYRFYKDSGNGYVDVTGTPDYSVDSEVATWQNVGAGDSTLITNDKYFFCREFTVDQEEPVIFADIGYYTGEGENRTFKTSPIPSAEVDVWLNGNALVENIDYFVSWPKVVITNKTNFNVRTSSNSVVVRARGHAPSDLVYKSASDSGFIKWGIFSKNDKYDVHWDQSLKVVINGRAVIPENVIYKDQHKEKLYVPYPGIFEAEVSKLLLNKDINQEGIVTVMGIDQNHPLNGKPYSLRDSYSGLTAAVPGSTRDYREDMLDFDQRLSTYLTERLPEDTPTVPNNISEKYPVVSPFLAACADALFDETIGEEIWNKYDFDEQEILSAMSEFTFLLDCDPTQDHIYDSLDMDIADIHAHPYYEILPVTLNQFRFLEFVAHVILNNRVDVSRFFTVGEVDYVEPPLNFLPHFYDEFDLGNIQTRAVRTGQFLAIPNNSANDGIHEPVVGDHYGTPALIPDYALPERRMTIGKWPIRVDDYRFFQSADFTIDFYHYVEKPNTDNGTGIPLEGDSPFMVSLSDYMDFSLMNLTYRQSNHSSAWNDVEEVGSEVPGVDRDNWVYGFYNDGATFPTYKKVKFGTWSHVAIVVDGVDIYLVVDGVVSWFHKEWTGSTGELARTFQDVLVRYLDREESNHSFAIETTFSSRTHPDERNGRAAIKHLRVTRGANQLYIDDIRRDAQGTFGSFDRPQYTNFPSEEPGVRTEDPANPPITIDQDKYYFHYSPDGTKPLILAPSQSGHYAHDFSKTEYPRRARSPWNGGMGERVNIGALRQIGPPNDIRWALTSRPTDANRKNAREGANWIIEEMPVHNLIEDPTDRERDFCIRMEFFFDKNGATSTSTPLRVFLTEYLYITFRMDNTDGRFAIDHRARFETRGIGGEWYVEDIIEADAWNEIIMSMANDSLIIHINGVIVYDIPVYATSLKIGKEYILNKVNSSGVVTGTDERDGTWMLVEGVAEFYEPFCVYRDVSTFHPTVSGVSEVSILKDVIAPAQSRGISYLKSVLNPETREIGDTVCLNVYDSQEPLLGYFYALSDRSDAVDGGVSEITDAQSITGTIFDVAPGGSIRLGISSSLPSISGGALTNVSDVGVPMAAPRDTFFEVHIKLDAGQTDYQPLLTPRNLIGGDGIDGGYVVLANSSSVLLGELFSDVDNGLEFYKTIEYIDGLDLTQDTVISVGKYRGLWHLMINGEVVFVRSAKAFDYTESLFQELVLFGSEGFRNEEEAVVLANGSPGDPEYDAIVPYVGLSGEIQKAFYLQDSCLVMNNHVVNKDPVVFTGLYDPILLEFTGTEYAGDESVSDEFGEWLISSISEVNNNEDRRYGGHNLYFGKGCDEYNFANRTGFRRRVRYGVNFADGYPELGSNDDYNSFYFSPGATALLKHFVDCIPKEKEMTNFIFHHYVNVAFERLGREVVIMGMGDMDFVKTATEDLVLRFEGGEVLLMSLPSQTRVRYGFAIETFFDEDVLMMRLRLDGAIQTQFSLDDQIAREDISTYRRCYLGASMKRDVASDPYGMHIFDYSCYVDNYYVPKDKSLVADNPHYDHMGLFINGGDNIDG